MKNEAFLDDLKTLLLDYWFVIFQTRHPIVFTALSTASRPQIFSISFDYKSNLAIECLCIM